MWAWLKRQWNDEAAFSRNATIMLSTIGAALTTGGITAKIPEWAGLIGVVLNLWAARVGYTAEVPK